MSTVKFALGTILFVIIYELVDRLAGLIPAWVGILFLISIVVFLIRLMFKIVKEESK